MTKSYPPVPERVARLDIPGPSPLLPMLGFVIGLPRVMERCQRRYGDIFSVRLPFVGRAVVLAEPDAIRSVYTSSDATVVGPLRAFTLRYLADGLTIMDLDGDPHRERRRLLHPHFHGAHLARYERIMADVVAAELRSWRPGEVVRMRDFAWTVTSNVISRVLFGDRDEMRAVRFAANYRGLVGGLSWGLFVPDPLKSERLMGPWRRLVRARHELREMFDAEIAARRAAGLGDCDGDGDGDADVCSLLVSAVDEDGNGLTDEEIHDELRSLGAAGIHTTAIVIQWMFDYLLRDPALLARVESDPDDVALGEAIVKETLRLRPPQDSAPRRLVKDVEAGGVRIPAGEVVVPANHLVHRRPELYERPEEFWPDRFLESRVNTFGWLPFGGGAHRCLGASFAELETRIVLREVLKRWRLRPVRKRISRARRSWVFWVPAGGVPVTVTPRTGEPRGTPSDPERALAETGPR